jgi:hypothetical protein
MTEQHPIDNLTGEPIKTKHCCHLCTKEFDFLSTLQKHIACHEKHKCTHCDAGFTRLSHLNVHISQVHTFDVPAIKQEYKFGEGDHQMQHNEGAGNSGNRRSRRMATE